MPIVQVGDIQLWYETSGRGEPLLFIHGLGSSTRDWQDQVGYFAQRHQVITLDLRGHGKSNKPAGPYSIPLFANDIAALITALDMAPVHLVGISLGGFIAFQLTVDHSHLVRSLTVVNSAPNLTGNNFWDRLRIAAALLLRQLIVRLFGMRAMAKFLGKKLFPRSDQNQTRQAFINRWSENHKQAYLDSLAAVSGWSMEDRLDAISCPVCVISGEYDFIPLVLKERYTARLANAELVVIPDSRHLTPVDQPAQFNEALLAFLARQG